MIGGSFPSAPSPGIASLRNYCGRVTPSSAAAPRQRPPARVHGRRPFSFPAVSFSCSRCSGGPGSAPSRRPPPLSSSCFQTATRGRANPKPCCEARSAPGSSGSRGSAAAGASIEEVRLGRERPPEERAAVEAAIGRCLTETDLQPLVPGLGPKVQGKVRDIYDAGDHVVLVTTDRMSAFDRVLASIPFKGQVLNLTSAWWFEQTAHISANAVAAVPHPNVTVARKCTVFPVEFVVRGFLTGSTSTSLWTVYKEGRREYCGIQLPEGLKKNERLWSNLLTPTTKAADHDEPVSPEQIIERGLMSRTDFEEVRRRAMALFAFGQAAAAERELLLVDTKYEFGTDAAGQIVLLDEVHTPDSSRYWLAASYEERLVRGLEPESIDKEFLRLWFRGNCDPYKDEVLPEAPRELVAELSWRYIALYEAITGQRFHFVPQAEGAGESLAAAVRGALR